MNVKNVWKATWFSFIVGFILVTFVALCLLLITNDINSSDDLYNVLFVLMVMGVVYSIVQFSFSFLLNSFLSR
jgi:ABC-type transport system involved in multi-copper enzyme maturation permease subunit